MSIEVPPGYVLVKRGGRPPKHARAVAVLLALRWREDREREKRHQAQDWAVSHWPELGDVAKVRKIVRHARGILPKQGAVIHGAAFALFVAAPPFAVHAGADGWLWTVGEREALKVKITNSLTEHRLSQTYNAWKAPRFGGRAETVSAPG